MSKATTLIKQALWLMLSMVLFGCFTKKQNEITHTFNHPKVDSLFYAIKTNEHSNVKALRKFAFAMTQIEDYKDAKIIGDYYLLKADYYTHATPEVIKQLEDIYKQYKTKDLDLKYNFIDNACNNINDLVYWKRDIPLQLHAIDLSIQSGHTRNLDMYYRVLGHAYIEEKIYPNSIRTRFAFVRFYHHRMQGFK